MPRQTESPAAAAKGGQELTESGIITIDVHGMSSIEAIAEIQKCLEREGSRAYRIRVIHGFNGGTRIRTAIREEFSYGRDERILRMEMGANQGITELVLREF